MVLRLAHKRQRPARVDVLGLRHGGRRHAQPIGRSREMTLRMSGWRRRPASLDPGLRLREVAAGAAKRRVVARQALRWLRG